MWKTMQSSDTVLNYQAGEEAKELTSQLQTQEEKLKEAGAFRTLLLRNKFDKTGKPKWSSEVHQLKEVRDGFAVGTDGVRERLRFVLPVSKDSHSVKLPAAIAGGDNARDKLRREKLQPFISALEAHIGTGSLHLQEAGNFLGTLPGYRDALDGAAAQKPEPTPDHWTLLGAEGRRELREPLKGRDASVAIDQTRIGCQAQDVLMIWYRIAGILSSTYD
jgi:hypothetical protein